MPPHLAIAFKKNYVRVRAHVDGFLHGATVHMCKPEEMQRGWFFPFTIQVLGTDLRLSSEHCLLAESVGVLGILRVLWSVW